jgi:hypothetical protein
LFLSFVLGLGAERAALELSVSVITDSNSLILFEDA